MKLEDMEVLMLQEMEVVRGGTAMAGEICRCETAAYVRTATGKCICETAAKQDGEPVKECECTSGAQVTSGLIPITSVNPTLT